MKKNKMLLAEIFDGNAVRLSSKLACLLYTSDAADELRSV